MSATWQCGVCETFNSAGRICSACGASLTRRSTIATAVRSRLTPVPPPPVTAPLPDPVRRAINREPIPAEDFEEFEVETRYNVTPIPGGCLVSFGPRLRW